MPTKDVAPIASKDPLAPLPTDMRGHHLESSHPGANLSFDRKVILLTFARWGARSVPEYMDTFGLLFPYLALERGDGLPLENYADSYLKLTHDINGRVDRRARELRLDIMLLAERIQPNLLHLVSKNRKMTAQEALDFYLNSISKDCFDLAPAHELGAARRQIAEEIAHWLRENRIPFSVKLPIHIPSTTLKTLLQPFKGLPDFHLGADIPPDKLANAVEAAHVPEGETIDALIDCTFFGSAEDCVLFGSRAIYFRNFGIDNFLPYSEFPDAVFTPDPNTGGIGYDFGLIDLDG
jgi:hypothetical protein